MSLDGNRHQNNLDSISVYSDRHVRVQLSKDQIVLWKGASFSNSL